MHNAPSKIFVMKKIFLIIFLALITLTMSGQTAAEQQKAIQTISRATAQMKTMQADFIQTKSLKMLGDKMVSKGRMAYQQSDKLRWEYTTPYTYTFILNGSKVTLRKGKRSDVIDVNRNKMFKEIARIMMNSMVGQCITDSKTFKVSVKTDAQHYTATLLPLKKDMKQMYSRIVLVFSRKTATVNRVMMYERNGDCTDIQLTNIRTNAAVSGKEFN